MYILLLTVLQVLCPVAYTNIIYPNLSFCSKILTMLLVLYKNSVFQESLLIKLIVHLTSKHIIFLLVQRRRAT